MLSLNTDDDVPPIYDDAVTDLFFHCLWISMDVQRKVQGKYHDDSNGMHLKISTRQNLCVLKFYN